MSCQKLLQLLEITDEVSDYECTGNVPANELYDVYSIRSRGDSGFAGFESLLSNLRTLSTQKIKVHTLKIDDHSIVAFTDSQVSQLFGTLKR